MPPLEPRPRELEPRERELVVRDLPALLRGFDALLDSRAPADLLAPVDLRAADERLAPEPVDLARVDVAFFAPVEREEVERFAPLLPLDDFAVERLALLLRAPPELLREVDAPDVPLLAEPLSLVLHLPDITRCAASATASAISEPSLVALAMTLLAAFSAVSAASRPASRIFLRAAGLALIAAAAAARPAASISLLIAALASLSTVLSLERERGVDEREPDVEEPDREELFRADFAIASSPSVR